MRLEDLGLIGNCQFSALIESTGSVVWCCLPRFDAEPIFSSLLDAEGGGFFRVAGAGQQDGRAALPRPTRNVLETTLPQRRGRVSRHRLRAALRSVRSLLSADACSCASSSRSRARRACASAAIRASAGRRASRSACRARTTSTSTAFEAPLRLTTDIPLSYLDGQPVRAHRAPPPRAHLGRAGRRAARAAVRSLSRRDGALLAALGEALQRAAALPGRGHSLGARAQAALLRGHRRHRRRDDDVDSRGARKRSHLGLPLLLAARRLLRALGAFATARPLRGARDGSSPTCSTSPAAAPTSILAPLYRIDGSSDLDEHILGAWPGYDGEGPVRVGNAAALHLQNDIFGEMVLALTPIFLDERFGEEQSIADPRSARSASRARRSPWSARPTPASGSTERLEAADLLEPDVLGRRRSNGARSPRVIGPSTWPSSPRRATASATRS